MNNISKYQVVDLIQKTDQVNGDIEKTTKVEVSDLEKTAEKYADKTSEFLAAIVGGVFGLSGAYGLTFAGASLVLSGPFGLAFGAATALLIWRGKGQHKVERANKKNASIKSSILSEINSLPDDAPQKVKDRLWDAYNNATEVYEKAVIEGLSDDTSRFNNAQDKMQLAEMIAANKSIAASAARY